MQAPRQVSAVARTEADAALRLASVLRARPAITSAVAPSFQAGMASSSQAEEAAMPNTGTSSAAGVTVAAGWRASSQFQAP